MELSRKDSKTLGICGKTNWYIKTKLPQLIGVTHFIKEHDKDH
jgi:hypothetical protein